jgi:hypothetical protein
LIHHAGAEQEFGNLSIEVHWLNVCQAFASQQMPFRRNKMDEMQGALATTGRLGLRSCGPAFRRHVRAALFV